MTALTIIGESTPIEQATLLTQVTAAVMAACDPALGIYWGNATLIVPKPVFIDFAVEVLPSGPPLHIWIDFLVGPGENAPETPGALRERLTALCGYLLENGPVIQDGNTIGADADEKIRVVVTESRFGAQGQVMALDYEGHTPTKPKWKFW